MSFCRLLLGCALALSAPHGSQAQGCGQSAVQPRIIGGSDAEPGSWPWIVALTYRYEGFPVQYCGGSLISDQWVLTATHCFDPPGPENSTMVHLGRHSWEYKNVSSEEVRWIRSRHCHTHYNQSGYLENDICLLQLSAPVAFSDRIRPICLPAQGSTFLAGQPSWVAGWGSLQEGGDYPEVLQEVMLPIVGINECRCLNELFIPEKTICAGFREGQKDSCQGDSGGPLVVWMPSAWVQVGVVSFGEGCARADRPGVYTLVSAYQDWISEVVEAAGSMDQPEFVPYNPPDEDPDLDYVCQNVSDYDDLDFLLDLVLDSGTDAFGSVLSVMVLSAVTIVLLN